MFKNKGKLSKKVTAIGMTALMVMSMTGAMANASSGTKIARNSYNQYSWCGVLCYSMGVEGNYHSNGTRIDKYSTAKAVTSTHLSWSVHDKSASWTYKGTTSGTVRAYATFKNGLSTTWIDLSIQSFDERISATAYK